ncbi:MAG: hypothetical protein ACLQAT_07200 [Candidatus Binataceae bacterium]
MLVVHAVAKQGADIERCQQASAEQYRRDDWSARSRARIGLILETENLLEHATAFAERMARVPLNQLQMSLNGNATAHPDGFIVLVTLAALVVANTASALSDSAQTLEGLKITFNGLKTGAKACARNSILR